MPRKSKIDFIDFHVARFTQISESHCGPAVIQMLLSNLGIEISQEAIAEAGGATELIEMNGMRIDQLARAVRKLAPQARFWYKDHSTIQELAALITEYRQPVGVEWQGVFEDPDEDDEAESDDTETGDTDYGHYSVVTHVNLEKQELIIADPYKDFIAQDRIFSLAEFEERWYDFNEVPDPSSEEPKLIEDFHMLFIVTDAGESFPQDLQMIPGAD